MDRLEVTVEWKQAERTNFIWQEEAADSNYTILVLWIFLKRIRRIRSEVWYAGIKGQRSGLFGILFCFGFF